MSDREEQQPDDRILRSARRPIAHLALGPEGDRYLFCQRRERQQQQRRGRAEEASRAFASEAAVSAAMATSTQQSSQASSSRSVGSTVAQTLSQSTGVMASQPIVSTPDEIAIQQAALQEAQLQKALGERKAEKERMIRRRARMQRRQADVSELEEMDLTHTSDDVRTIQSVLLNVVEMQDHQTAILQDIQQSLALLAGRAQAAPSMSGPGALITEFNLADNVTQSLVEAYREDPFMAEIICKLEAKDKQTSVEFELVKGLLFLEKAGNKRFSKFARLVAMPTTAKTEDVIKMFKENWVRDFGLPKSIVSDRDVRFTSELWKAAAAEQGTQLQMTSGNHPKANGQAEQMNRAVQHLLRHYIKPNQVDRDEKLALIINLYNSVVHSATGVSPNSLLLTFRPRLPLDFLLPDNQPTAAPGTLEFAYRYEHLMQQAVEQMHKAQATMIESENKHRRPSTFQVGEGVWVKSSELGQEYGISRKLMPHYFGPWEVLDVVGNEPDGPSYVIRILRPLRTYPVFHASKLAPFKETNQFPSRRSILLPTMDGEVDIDDIVDHRELPVPRPTGRGRPPKPKLQYRVRFRHHLDPKDRWFTREELMQTAPHIIAQYEKSLQKGKRQIIED
ncbi:hypothetical protein CBR_g25754 [Chara braunii]|uniref:Integrase catalytic domain-containing protein n=1 Tax=Chara braunii TaxID=69332 RepID=A0A388L6J2_CHABU|nr:hypothetical protein CBR_g25754 [Chara braunii]|eukprot:GBG77823.1 hypothetical protein CBR_g25754 [Chara braunii]